MRQHTGCENITSRMTHRHRQLRNIRTGQTYEVLLLILMVDTELTGECLNDLNVMRTDTNLPEEVE